MNPFRLKIEELADRAKSHHDRERGDTLESVDFVGELIRLNASGYLGLDTRQLAKRVGLTPDQFLKRAQAARVLRRFPAFRVLLAEGQTSLSNLRLIAPRLTEANRAYFLENVRGRSARQVARLVKGIDPSGRTLISKDKRQLDALLDRAFEIARTRGRPLSRNTLLKEALQHWLAEWEVSEREAAVAESVS